MRLGHRFPAALCHESETRRRAVTPDDMPPVIPSWNHAQLRLFFSAVVLGLLLGWTRRQTKLALGGDEATYLTLSQSLEHGRHND